MKRIVAITSGSTAFAYTLSAAEVLKKSAGTIEMTTSAAGKRVSHGDLRGAIILAGLGVSELSANLPSLAVKALAYKSADEVREVLLPSCQSISYP